MRSEHHSRLLPLRGNIRDNSPHEASSLWVHTGTGFVKQDDRWISNQRDSTLKFAFITATEFLCLDVVKIDQVHFPDLFGHEGRLDVTLDSLD